MKKLYILLFFCIIVGVIYYGFVIFKNKTEEKIKEEQNTKIDINNNNDTVTTIDSAYYSVCSAYIDSINYQITINQITGSIPSVITDPEYTSSRITPLQVNLEISDKGIVSKGTVVYEHVICEYENGKPSLRKKS